MESQINAAERAKLDNLGSPHIVNVDIDADYDAYKLMVASPLPRPQGSGPVNSPNALVFPIAIVKKLPKM